MEKINLPDGQVINIPDNIDPIKRSELAGAIKRQYDIDIDKVSILDRVVDAPKSIARGTISTVANVPLGLASLFDIGNDSEVVKGLQGFRDYLREDSIFASDPSLRNKYTTKLAEGFGSFGPFLGAGLAGRALARRGVVSPAVGTFGLPAALAVPTGISEQVDRLEIARDMGEEANAGQEILSELIGGAIGLSEIAPIAAFLKRVPKSAARNPEINARITQIAKDFTTGFAFEGAQESIASLTQDLVARGLYSDTLPIGESFFDELTIGGIVGGTAKAVINSLGRKQGIKSEYAEEKIRREQENKKDLLRAKKFQQAQEQGTLTEVQDVPQVVKPELVVPEATLPEPDLTVVSLPNNTFSIVDNNNTTQPIVETFTSEADALSKKEELLTDFNNQRLTQELNKQLYLQGNINSATAFEIGQSLLDPIATTVTPNDIIAFRTKISDKAKQSFLENNTKPLTLEEAKKNLTKKEFNDLASALARAQLKANEKNGQPSITAGKDSINTTPKYIKELAESKNIDNFNPNSPAVAHALKIYTGSNDLKGMSKGQKELLVARLHALPKFNQKQEFPDFRPKEYSAKDMADFISKIDKTSFTLKDVENNFDGDKGKAAMFISQLQKSGRAEFLKEEGAYRIKDNFEFEIARRAEAFDQTPEEFGASLREQGTLSEDVIAKLVEEETVRQEKVLPPEEIEPKLINFAEAIEEGRTNKFAKEIRKQLDKFGLSDTGVVVSDDILSTTTLRQTTEGVAFDPREVREGRVEGEYDRNTDIIFLSLNAVNPDGNATDFEIEQRLRSVVNHEVIHALRAKDLLTEPEYNYLRKLVKQRKVPKDFDENYANKTFYDRAVDINRGTIEARRQAGLSISDERAEELYIEEAIAEMYRAKDIGPTMPNKVNGIFNKFIEFFKGIGQAMRTSGYKNVANVFAEIEQGRVGRRARGELRTTRELDRGAAISQLPADLQAEKDRRDRAAAQAEQPLEEMERGVLIDTVLTPKELSRLEPLAPVEPTPPVKPPEVVAPPEITTPPVEPKKPEPKPKPIPTEPIPNTIYDAKQKTKEELEAEKELIVDGLVQAKVISKSDGAAMKYSVQKVNVKAETIPMMKWLAKNPPSEDYRIIANKTLETLNKLKQKGATFPLTFVSNLSGAAGSVTSSPYGRDYKMQIDVDRGLNYETLLHEALHSATLFQMTRVARLIERDTAPDYLIEIFERQEKGSDKKDYGISKKTIQAYKNLEEQKVRIKKYITAQKRKFTKLTRELSLDDYRKAIRETENSPILQALAQAIGAKAYKNEPAILKQWNQTMLNYVMEGGRPKASPDLSEFITFGLTDRQFQNFLENIPYDDKGKKTVWNKFVEAIRDILNLPVKLDTEFAAFLNNVADVFYDPEIEQTKLRAPPDDIPTFSRGDLERKEIENQIYAAEDMIYRLEREEYLEGNVMTVGSLNRLQGRIRQQKRNLEFFKNQLANLPKEIRTPVQLNLLPDPNDEDLPTFARMKGRKDVYDGSTNRFGDRLKARKYFMYALQPNRETWLGRLYPFHMNKIETKTTREGEPYSSTARQEDLSKRLYKTDTPRKDETINNIAAEARKVIRLPDFISSFGEYLKQSRKGSARKIVNEDGTLDLKQVPLKTKDFAFIEAIENNPTLKQHMNWFLSQFTNKRGNLILYRSLNNPKGFKLKHAQNPFDDFSSTSLIREDMKYISVPTRKIPLGANAQAVIDTARAELSPVQMDEMLGGAILNQDKAKEREDFKQLVKDVTEIASLPQTIYRYEVPLDRVKVYIPYVKSLLEDSDYQNEQLAEVLFDDSVEAGGGYDSGLDEPNRDDFEDESEYEDALYEYESEVERLKEYEVDEEFGAAADAAREEVEVIADLSGLQPQLEYMPEQEIQGETFGPSLTKYDTDIPMFSKGTRYNKNDNSSESRQLLEATKRAEEQAKSQPRGGIPRYNTNASDIALKTAIDFENDPNMSIPDDIPNWSKPTLDGVDDDIKAGINRTGGQKAPEKSFGARLIETLKDPITNIGFYFRDFRENYVDKLDKVDKKILQGIQDNEQVRAFNNTADTASIASIRLADRARGLFQGLLTTGTITDKIDGIAALANVVKTEDGGLIQILAPLYSKPEVDQEAIFKFYASLQRTEQFLKDGRVVKSPIKEEDLALIKKIEVQYPDVKNVFEAYQRWNNALITFAENKGLLSKFKSNNKIIEELEKKGIDQATLDRLAQLSKENGGRSVQEIREFAVQNDIDIRGQADLWREHSSYYPFYRDMVDDTGITAPTVAGGSLPNNPLSISLEGSEDPLNINPLEAISRNSLSILTASLKNDGLAKLIRDLELMGEAREVTPKESAKLNTIFVFDEGIKRHYEVDVELVNALQSVGGTQRGMIEKALAIPAGFLRETVTRDPGFVVVNILRDTFSTMVTSGADFVPVIDSFKNLVGDMENLKKFGVLGGYDFSNDEGSVKEYITRTMRREGLTPDNGMSAQKLFFKLWDGLGELTTRSDGATRQAVYDGVYKKLIKEGYNEAQAQSEAAYQALEIINFGRRGLNPTFKIITAAIPFFNARIQGLDIIYRAGSGRYSAVEKLQQGETLKDVQGRILKNVGLKAGVLSAITLIYYLLVHDSDEYKNLKREVRDDNWVVPVGFNHAVKIPIPFEVGFLFKVIPERFFDMTLGDEAFTRSSVNEAGTSISRGLGTSLAIPFFDAGGVQALKPIVEALINKNSFTKQDIVPYYQLQREPALQFREGTSQLAKEIGEQLNISPAKVEHVFRGYTGTLGGYVVALSDTITRLVTGEPLMPKNVSFLQNTPLRRLLLDYDKSGGLQQQFYELRGEVDRAVATINSLKKEKRFDELSAYRTNRKGVLDIKGQVRALEKYLANFRERRNRLLLNENISVAEKSERLRQMEIERDKRLAFVPELRKRANLPVINMNPF